MPRLTKSLPRYSKHRASNLAVVYLNSKAIYLGRYNSKASKVEYDRVIEEWLATGRSSNFRSNESSSIEDAVTAYLRFARSYYGDGKRGEYANLELALRPVLKLYGKAPADEFSCRHMKVVRQSFIRMGHCRSNVNASVRRINRFFKWAATEELVPAGTATKLSLLPGLRKGKCDAPEGKKVKPVADELVDATLPFLNPVVRAMVLVQRACGCRSGELVIVRPCDVDRSGPVWVFRPMTHKNAHRDQSRAIYLGPQAQAILEPFLNRDDEAFCFSPAEAVTRHLQERAARRRTPVSRGNRPGTNRQRKPKRTAGERYSPQSYHYAIRRACDRAFPVAESINNAAAIAVWRFQHRWHPHQLRHAHATKSRREFGLEVSRVLLGHTKLETTQLYAERDHEAAIKAAAVMG